MYFCPCCGYRTFYESPPGSYLVCPICFWEDTGDIWGIRKAQLNFLSYGACEREWLEQVRQPKKQDEKNPHWQLLDEQIKAVGTKLIEQISTAFENVKREDGISLNEAHAIYLILDNYEDINSLESQIFLASARAKDVDTCWQEILPSCLSKFLDRIGIWFYYLDLKGWRYYLPAFMVYSIRNYIDYDTCDDLDEVIDAFFCPKDRRVLDKTERVLQTVPRSEYLNSITAEQLAATSQFLKFIIDYVPNSYEQEEAQELIKQWHKTNQQSI